jgi:hypothetical protein
MVSAELAARHQRYACRAYLEAAGRLVLPTQQQGVLVHPRIRGGAGIGRAPGVRGGSWDIPAMGLLDYDITRYQPVLSEAESFSQVRDELQGLFASYDDEMPAQLASH